jgi:2-deoxy-D-gluconate 3-dehydrogenase
MANSLAGKRAFITGSFQGIGLGIATSLAREGAAIVCSVAKVERARG